MNKRLIIILLILLSGCTTNNYQNKIIIENINIEEKITLSSIYDEVNGIVMFIELGRPNKEKTNTVVGAHSGIGDNAYFNDLNKLNIGDEIQIIYENINYEFIVLSIYTTDKNDTSVLNSKEYTSLTLITCDTSDKNKRIIVEARRI